MSQSVLLIKMRSLGCVSLLVFIFSLAVAIPELTNDAGAAKVALKERTRREAEAVTSNLTYTGCGHFSQWISRNTPTSPFSHDEERFTTDDLEILCPSALGNKVKDFRCKDEKGEAIHDKINETNVDKTFVYTCDNMSASCNVLNSTGAKCPDYAIKIRCECPPPTSTQSPFSGNAATGSSAMNSTIEIGIGLTTTIGKGVVTTSANGYSTISGPNVTGRGTNGTWPGSGIETSVSGTGSVTRDTGLGSGSGTSGLGTGGGTGGSGAGSGASSLGSGGGTSGSGAGSGTSGLGSGGGTSGSGTGSGTSGLGSEGGTSGSGTGNGTSGLGTGGGTSGSGAGSGTSGSGTGVGTSGSGTGSGTSGLGTGGGTSGSGAGSGTGGNQSGSYDSFAGSSSADGNLSAGGTSLPWWLIPLFVSLVLFVVNLILIMFVYNKLKQRIGNNQVGPI